MFYLIILQNFFAALTVIIEKTILTYEKPLLYLSVRMLFAAAMMFAHRCYRLKTARFSSAIPWRAVTLVGFVQLYGAYLLNALVLPAIPVAYVCLIFNLSPFVTAFFAYIYFRETITPKKWLGLAFGLVGFLFLLNFNSNESFHGGWYHIVGLIAAVIANCYGFIVMKTIIKDARYSVYDCTIVATFISGILFLCTTALLESHSWPLLFDPLFVGYAVLLAFVGSGLTYGLYILALNYYSATFISFCMFIYVLFGALLGWLVLGESLSWHFAVSMLFIVTGLYIFYRQENKKS